MFKTDSALTINGDRLNQRLAELATIGQLPTGGISRVAFSPADLAARKLVQQWMEAAAMTVRVDAAGNLIGRYPGQEDELAAITTGSHIDTVPVAGRYDGCLGVLAGIEVVQTLKEQGLHLRHPIEVIVFTDEESTVLGCKAMTGHISKDPDVYRRMDGTSIQTCLAAIGGDWDHIATANREPRDIKAFVELHVEQGGLLDREGLQIGVVTGIVGQYRFGIVVQGKANHAGTTPMTERQDALVAASQVVLAVRQLALSASEDLVATVGALEVFPNSVNTVPGKVELKIDLRDLSQSRLDAFINDLKLRLAEIATETKTKIDLAELLYIAPTLADDNIMAEITEVCEQMRLSHRKLPSRAGHDAQELGRLTAMGMIFVPSQAGISHSADEYTSPQDCALGAEVLFRTFLRLDRR